MGIQQIKIDHLKPDTSNPYRAKAIETVNAACNELLSAQAVSQKNPLGGFGCAFRANATTDSD